MANPEHLEILKQGAEVWNEWRRQNIGVRVDLTNSDLSGIELAITYPKNADGDTNTIFIYPVGADLVGVNLAGSNLSKATLISVNLRGASLDNVIFNGATIFDTDFTKADLIETDFEKSLFRGNTFGSNDLSISKGLVTVAHFGPSIIGIDTLYRSSGRIPEAFLRGCGVPEDFITFIPSHFGIQQAIQFYSCFISYSTKDEEFTRRLNSRMRDEHLRVWFAPEDVKSGEKLYEQIERAIQVHDRLLIVLSESSLQSKWVMTEIRRARKVELRENRRKLFPIRLVNFDILQSWDCFDADTGEDLAAEVRQYFIPDFSHWREHNAFEAAFDRLLRDLKAEEIKP